jgi:hypothetical protein
MDYPLLSKKECDEWKVNVLALASFVVIGIIAWVWASQDFGDISAEREFAWTVVFSDKRIHEKMGRVKDAQMKWKPMPSGRSRHAHDRKLVDGIVHGTADFFVFGEEGAGEVLVSYHYAPSARRCELVNLVLTVSYSGQVPPK